MFYVFLGLVHFIAVLPVLKTNCSHLLQQKHTLTLSDGFHYQVLFAFMVPSVYWGMFVSMCHPFPIFFCLNLWIISNNIQWAPTNSICILFQSWKFVTLKLLNRFFSALFMKQVHFDGIYVTWNGASFIGRHRSSFLRQQT